MIRTTMLLLAMLALVSPLWSQDVRSGPEKGAKVASLQVYDATGMHKDQTVDYAAERKERPTIYLLIQADKFDRPMNRFMKTLDQLIKKDHPDVYAVAVWLTEDQEKTREFLPRVQQSVQYEATALTCFGDRMGPKDWGVNADAHLTVVVADKGKVKAVFGFQSVNETDVKGVAKTLMKE